jgi:hypothetical protein
MVSKWSHTEKGAVGDIDWGVRLGETRSKASYGTRQRVKLTDVTAAAARHCDIAALRHWGKDLRCEFAEGSSVD